MSKLQGRLEACPTFGSQNENCCLGM
jgi:hypothetical protein